jgi:hypothetical protein
MELGPETVDRDGGGLKAREKFGVLQLVII